MCSSHHWCWTSWTVSEFLLLFSVVVSTCVWAFFTNVTLKSLRSFGSTSKWIPSIGRSWPLLPARHDVHANQVRHDSTAVRWMGDERCSLSSRNHFSGRRGHRTYFQLQTVKIKVQPQAMHACRGGALSVGREVMSFTWSPRPWHFLKNSSITLFSLHAGRQKT